MKLKTKYIIKYTVFRALPFALLWCVMLALIYYALLRSGTYSEVVLWAVLGSAAIICMIVYFAVNIIRFSQMTDSQAKRYGVVLSDRNAVILSRIEQWVILTDQWLIQPGKIALYKGNISGASVRYVNSHHVVYSEVRMKTRDGKLYKVRFRKEKDARRVQNWV